MNGYAIAAALVLGGLVATSAAAWFGAAAKPQPLAELGTVAVPGRLDPYAADEADDYTVFSFDHTPGSIFLMGSNRPVSEVLALAVWRADKRAAALEALTRRVADRTRNIRWSPQGSGRIGEGTHEVNTSQHAARIVVREYPERQLAIGHMVWTERSLTAQQQMALVDATASSFAQRMPVADYLRLASGRVRD